MGSESSLNPDSGIRVYATESAIHSNIEKCNALHKKASFEDFMSVKKTPQKTEPSSASKIVISSYSIDVIVAKTAHYIMTI